MPATRTVSIRRERRPDVFGHIEGIPVGTRWDSRQACSDSAVHPGIVAGIYGRKDEGAFSIALSGGYEDDVDKGYKFTYTGCGGRDLGSGEQKRRVGPQAYDQTFDEPKNRALKVSSFTRKPVRVVRGFKLDSDFAPAEGYRYDGLYVVQRAWREKGKSGFLVCKYEFRRLRGQPPIPRREGTIRLNLPKKRSAPPRADSPLPEPKFEGYVSKEPEQPPVKRPRTVGKRKEIDRIPEPKFEGYVVGDKQPTVQHPQASDKGEGSGKAPALKFERVVLPSREERLKQLALRQKALVGRAKAVNTTEPGLSTVENRPAFVGKSLDTGARDKPVVSQRDLGSSIRTEDGHPIHRDESHAPAVPRGTVDDDRKSVTCTTPLVAPSASPVPGPSNDITVGEDQLVLKAGGPPDEAVAPEVDMDVELLWPEDTASASRLETTIIPPISDSPRHHSFTSNLIQRRRSIDGGVTKPSLTHGARSSSAPPLSFA